MKPTARKAKGSDFERWVAKAIIAAYNNAGYSFGQDCWRTPMSGGHPIESLRRPGDLQFSEQLSNLFPFVVECKHQKGFRLEYLFRPNTLLRSFLAQALSQADNSGSRQPLLVVRSNWSIVLAVTLYRDYFDIINPILLLRMENIQWVVMSFNAFLEYWVSGRRAKTPVITHDAKASFDCAAS